MHCKLMDTFHFAINFLVSILFMDRLTETEQDCTINLLLQLMFSLTHFQYLLNLLQKIYGIIECGLLVGS
jgi:hypothetical protein